MKKKKLLALLLVGAMTSSLSVSVFADEQETNTWLGDQMENSFSSLNFELAEMPDSAEMLNLKYVCLQATIENNGFGDNYEITLPDSLEISGNAADLFEKEYGDIDFSMEKLEIPEDFSAENILNQSKEMVNTNYAAFVNSDKYDNIYNAVSTYAMTSTLSEDISSPSKVAEMMENNKDIQGMLKAYSNKDKIEESFYEDVRDTASKNEETLVKKNHTDGITSSATATKNAVEEVKKKAMNGVETPQVDASAYAGIEKTLSDYFGQYVETILKAAIPGYGD